MLFDGGSWTRGQEKGQRMADRGWSGAVENYAGRRDGSSAGDRLHYYPPKIWRLPSACEFRTLGLPCNSGVFIQTRYEANINETYGRLERAPNGGFDNCLPSSGKPKIRPWLPPLAWQTFDIDFRAPRFDASGEKTENARATVLFNGVKIYDDQELEPPHLAAGRFGEAPTGPLMLQEHGMPVQFRNVWKVPAVARGAAATGANSGFHHPGVLVNRDQLDFVKGRIAVSRSPGEPLSEPRSKCVRRARLHTASPRDGGVRLAFQSRPGCKAEQADSEAAYAQALLWCHHRQRVVRRNRHQDHECLVRHPDRRPHQ